MWRLKSNATEFLEFKAATYGSNEVSDVGNGGARGSTKVEDLGARLHVDVLNTTDDTSSQLGSEGVPHSVFNLFSCFLDLLFNSESERL